MYEHMKPICIGHIINNKALQLLAAIDPISGQVQSFCCFHFWRVWGWSVLKATGRHGLWSASTLATLPYNRLHSLVLYAPQYCTRPLLVNGLAAGVAEQSKGKTASGCDGLKVEEVLSHLHWYTSGGGSPICTALSSLRQPSFSVTLHRTEGNFYIFPLHLVELAALHCLVEQM